MCPIYEWQCQNCGKIEEIMHHFEEPSDIEAPLCCGKYMERRISVVNHTFGWRLTEASHIRGNPDEFERRI